MRLIEKIDFLQANGDRLLVDTNSNELYQFLKNIILNVGENTYLRKKALECFVSSILLKKIKIRQALTVLVDEWVTDELYLELERIKSIYLFFEHDKEGISAILKATKASDEAELSAEAVYNEGLIMFQEALVQQNVNDICFGLKSSRDAFLLASTIIENRVDAQILILITEVLTELFQQKIAAAKQSLSMIANQLFQIAIVTFGPEKSRDYIGFYRALTSLVIIVSENPGEWLSFRDDMMRMLYHFSIVQNEKIENRLFASVSHKDFVQLISSQIIDPYFALNFKAEKSKIELLKAQTAAGTDEFIFFNHLLELLEVGKNETRILSKTIEQSLKKIFIHRTQESIDNAISGIANLNNVHEVVTAYEALAMPSIERFIDKLIYSCVILQGNRQYWGNCLEDDRNTFIANMLEAADYQIKDQTRWSISHGGKSAGEIDILIKDTAGLPFTIIEALNLKSLAIDYLILHLDKIFKYDANGLLHNFILVYYEGKKFDTFCRNYFQFISNHNYPYTLIRADLLILDMTDLIYAKTIHLRNQKEVNLYHLVIDLNKI